MYSINFLMLLLYFLQIQGTSHYNIEKTFNEFIIQHGRNYKNSSKEYYHRFQIFKTNLAIQKQLNSSRQHHDSAWYGPTEFSDMTQEEFVARYLSSYKESHTEIKQPFNLTQHINQLPFAEVSSWSHSIPKRIDWRERNVVTPVKQQGHCGGCWAFAAVEAVESSYAKKTKNLQSLSVQEVMDCSYAYEMLSGCKGGDPCVALKWMKEEKVHLVPEKKYRTKDKSEQCQIQTYNVPGVQVHNYSCSSFINKEYNLLLKKIAESGPVSVSVDAYSWNNYMGGIIQYHCGTQRGNNHAVDIVGYDITGDIPYYIVKNSWGTKFGDQGYLYIEIGKCVCGIAKEVAYDIVTGDIV